MLSSDYRWTTKKKSKPIIKIFREDDFKFFIFICIFIFCLAGLVLLITGVFVSSDLHDYTIFAGEDYRAISVFITVVGAFILSISVIGIYGVFNDINTIIYTYFFCLFLIITAQCAASISALKLRADFGDKLDRNMKRGLENYGKEGQEKMTKAWETVQVEMECCGMKNFTDWVEEQVEIPPSCYLQSGDVDTVFGTGCYSPVLTKIVDNITIVIVACTVVILLELVGLAIIGSS